MKIIDISLPLFPGMPMYPGNPDFTVKEIESLASKSLISELSFGTHTGTHIDAQKHAVSQGKSIDTIPLETFYGPCRVIDCTQDDHAVSLSTIAKSQIQEGERILLKTKNSLRGFETFYPDFIFVSPEAAEYLSQKNIALIGIDALSVKQKGSLDNRPHTYFLDRNIPILEGIDLSHVESGTYTLIAFPVKYVGLDGAHTRAVLLG